MKRIAISLTALLLLGGCTTADLQSTGKAIATASLDAICANLSTASITVNQYAIEGRITAKQLRIANDAIAGIQGTCDSRPITNTATTLTAASAAFARIVAIEAAARK